MAEKSPLAKLVDDTAQCTRIGQQLTPIIWNSTIPIVVLNDGILSQQGTGSLLRVAQRHFLVTAAHVVNGIREHGYKFVVFGKERGYIELVGPFQCLRRDSANGHDQFDLTIWELDKEVVEFLADYDFVNLLDVDTSEVFGPDLYCVCGFPAELSTDGNVDGTPIGFTPHYFLSYPYQGDVSQLPEYDSGCHLLLHGQPSDAVAIVGSGNLPKLNGISGCSIWKTNYLAIGPEDWTPAHAKIVAVETGVYRVEKAIKATIWKSVATLIYKAFEDLRPALTLHWPRK